MLGLHDAGKHPARDGELQRALQGRAAAWPPVQPRFWIGGIIAAVIASAATACGASSGNGPQHDTHHSSPVAHLSKPSGASATAAASPSSGGVPVVTTDMPVLIDSVMYQQAADDGFTYAFPRQLTTQQVASMNNLPVSFQDYINEVTSTGGTNVGDTDVQVVVRGNAAGQTAVIAGMDVMKSCQSPLNGTLLYSPSAGEDTDIEIGFNLDNEFPVAQNYRSGRLSGSFFGAHTISLRKGETQTLLVHAVTRQSFCQFTYRLLVDTGGRQVAEVISDNGRPFTVTAGLKSSAYKALYAGGVASPAHNDKYVAVDPKSYSQTIVSP
jgi:hypothetical protein